MVDMNETLECINPGGVDEGDIPAYVAGEGRPDFIAHLAKCRYCQSEAASYAAFEQRLENKLGLKRKPSRVECLDVQQIGEYSLGLLGKPARQKVEEHLKGCFACTAEYKKFQVEQKQPFLMTETFASPAETPAATVSRLLRRVVAVLSMPQPQVALRGASTSATGAPQEYQAEDVTIVVRVQPARVKRHNVTVSGTTSRENISLDENVGAEVRLLREEEVLATENLDESGSFFFENIAAAPSYNLEIHLPDKIVLVPDIRSL